MLMRNTTLLILLSFLAGCKLQIIVPVGGTVTTASGTYTCSAGQICEIDVVDLLFDETFTAVPDAGYLFAQWNKKSGGRGFCATDSSRHNPCRLYTSFFAGWPNLFAFLAMDEVFYLEPVFEAAAECEADTLTAQYRVSSCEFGGAGSKLVLMDFDLDGDLDVIRWGIVPDDQWTGTYPYYEGDPPNPLTAWRNNGNNRFFEATTTVFGEEPIQIIRATLARVIDMDGDGLKDLFIGDGGPDGLPETSPYYDPEHSVHGSYSWLFMQKRSGTLSDESDARLPRILGFTHGMTIGDIEGDGDQDIFLANIWSEQAGTECREAEVLPTADAPCPGFFINDGKGYFSSDLTRIPEEVTRVTHDERGELRWQDGLLIDVDNDGLVELIGNKQLADYLLLNDGAGFFLEENEGAIPERLAGGEQSFDPNNYPLPISTTLTLEMIDINNDGFQDVLAGLSNSDPDSDPISAVQILVNRGDGTFADETSTRLTSYMMDTAELGGVGLITVFDINQDGFDDFVVRSIIDSTTGVTTGPELMINDGTGVFDRAAAEYGLTDMVGQDDDPYPEDLDGDGDIDFMVDSVGTTVTIFTRID